MVEAPGASELRQILFWRWDPIGVSAAFPVTVDEYDSYRGRVLKLAKEGASEQYIAAYLGTVERDRTTLSTSSKHRAKVGRLVLDWYAQSIERWQESR